MSGHDSPPQVEYSKSMARIALILATLALAACDPGTGAIVYASTATPGTDLSSGSYQDGAALLGLELRAGKGMGVIVFAEVVEVAEDIVGHASTHANDCIAFAVVHEAPEPRLVAHEIGHVLGLPHLDVPGNIMHTSQRLAGDDITQEQLDMIQDRAIKFENNHRNQRCK